MVDPDVVSHRLLAMREALRELERPGAGSEQELAADSMLRAELASKLGDAAALRNILVHDYVSVDLRRLAATVRDDLADLRAFAAEAAKWIV